MTIYEELVERVSNGETFLIELQMQTMKVGKDFLIKNGEYDNSRNLFSNPKNHCSMELLLGTIEALYQRYKYSLPSERSDKKSWMYFKALPIEEITDKQLMEAERREVAKAKLEGFILCMILEGKFQWTEDMGSWFWQSKNEPDLVILKKWIERKGE